MSAGEDRDGEAAAPVYVYESKVHCANVLLSLEEQRRQGILCDVTVLVEGREVRAHRAVLAASSRYFLQALLGHNGSPGEPEPIINLPDKVTAKGFAPLLQFAYTAKLVLSRENIHEVILCADFLGVHNLEDSCFRFLQAQLQNDSQHWTWTFLHIQWTEPNRPLPSSSSSCRLLTGSSSPPPTSNMADSKVESSGELSAKELKEKKQAEETENGDDATANGKTDEENGEQENEVEDDEDDVGEDEDEDGEGDEDDDEEDDLDAPTGKRTAEDDEDDDEDEVETKKQKTDK